VAHGRKTKNKPNTGVINKMKKLFSSLLIAVFLFVTPMSSDAALRTKRVRGPFGGGWTKITDENGNKYFVLRGPFRIRLWKKIVEIDPDGKFVVPENK
jgi:hypothetical protein